EPGWRQLRHDTPHPRDHRLEVSPASHRSRKGAPKGAPFLYPAPVTLRVGVIGAGFAGAMHARSAHDLDGVRVTAIAAATPEEAAPVAEECGARIEPDPFA